MTFEGEIVIILSIENKTFVEPLLFATKDDCECCDHCTKEIFVYFILNQKEAKTCCVTKSHFVVQFNNTLYVTKLEKSEYRPIKFKETSVSLKVK